jgi:hypothetical protein
MRKHAFGGFNLVVGGTKLKRIMKRKTGCDEEVPKSE